MKMKPNNTAKMATLAEHVYTYVRDLASVNDEDTGEILRQALHWCTNKKDDKSGNQSSTEVIDLITTDDSPEKDTSWKSTAKPGTFKSQIPSLKDVANDECERTKEYQVHIQGEEDTPGVERIPQATGDLNAVVKEKECSSRGPETVPDYFDMDCEEIDDYGIEERTEHNSKEIFEPKPEVIIIDDDEDSNGASQQLHETPIDKGIGIPPTNENGKDCNSKIKDVQKSVKSVNQANSTNVINSISDMNSFDVIDLDSDSEDETDDNKSNTKRNISRLQNKTNNAVKTISSLKNETDNIVRPVSIVKLFTNRSQLSGSSSALTGNNCFVSLNQLSVSPCVSQSDQGTKSMIKCEQNQNGDQHKATGSIQHIMNSVGLVCVQENFPKVMPVQVQKRPYADDYGLVKEECLPAEEGSSSPRIKKRLLDFDKKWNLAPQCSPMQDKYLAAPGGIEANIYNGDVTKHSMPLVSHMDRAKFRKAGIYSSISSSRPKVVIESVDSNKPYHSAWDESYLSVSGQNIDLDQECENGQADGHDSDYSDDSDYTSSCPSLHSNSNGFTKMISYKRKVLVENKHLNHSLERIEKSKFNNTRGRGRGRGQSVKVGRGHRGASSSVGRGSKRGRGNNNYSGRRIRGRGSQRGRGRGLPRGEGSARGQSSLRGRLLKVPVISTGRGSSRGQRSIRGRLSKVQAISRGRGSSRGQSSLRGHLSRGGSSSRGQISVRGQSSRGRGSSRGQISRRGRLSRGRGSSRGQISLAGFLPRGRSSSRGQISVRGRLARGRGSTRGQSYSRGQGTSRGRGRGRGRGSRLSRGTVRGSKKDTSRGRGVSSITYTPRGSKRGKSIGRGGVAAGLLNMISRKMR